MSAHKEEKADRNSEGEDKRGGGGAARGDNEAGTAPDPSSPRASPRREAAAEVGNAGHSPLNLTHHGGAKVKREDNNNRLDGGAGLFPHGFPLHNASQEEEAAALEFIRKTKSLFGASGQPLPPHPPHPAFPGIRSPHPSHSPQHLPDVVMPGFPPHSQPGGARPGFPDFSRFTAAAAAMRLPGAFFNPQHSPLPLDFPFRGFPGAFPGISPPPGLAGSVPGSGFLGSGFDSGNRANSTDSGRAEKEDDNNQSKLLLAISFRLHLHHFFPQPKCSGPR